MKKLLYIIFAFFSLSLALFLATALLITFYFSTPNEQYYQEQNFIIEKGQNLRDVSYALYGQGFIKSPIFFLYGSQLFKGHNPKIYPGEYRFDKNSSYYQIIDKIAKGEMYLRKITIIEGATVNSILKAVDSAYGLKGSLPSKIAEGSLFPETYFYYYGQTKEELIERMRQAMQATIDQLWEKRNPDLPVKDKNEAVILASIVEKETGLEAERPLVASVFVNRLKKRMKLQSDPTIIYSFTLGNKDLERPITTKDIRNKSPINTYHIYGLPPTAICNPGLASLQAVLNPPTSDYIYFVAKGDGGHYFSSNLKEHSQNVARYYHFLKEQNKNTIAAPKAQ